MGSENEILSIETRLKLSVLVTSGFIVEIYGGPANSSTVTPSVTYTSEMFPA